MLKRNSKKILSIGSLGFVIQMMAILITAGSIYYTSSHITLLLGLSLLLLGTGLLIWSLGLLAQAKDRSVWWGLYGFFGLLGVLILAAIEDREFIRRHTLPLPEDISQPPTPYTAKGFCFECGYMLNGVTSTNCPECGLSFNPDDLSTMRFDRPDAAPKIPSTTNGCQVLGLLSVMSFCLCGSIIGLALAIPSIILGHVAISEVRRQGDRRVGYAATVVGLLLGYLGLLLGLITLSRYF